MVLLGLGESRQKSVVQFFLSIPSSAKDALCEVTGIVDLKCCPIKAVFVRTVAARLKSGLTPARSGSLGWLVQTDPYSLFVDGLI
jgi:hypothetical protein